MRSLLLALFLLAAPLSAQEHLEIRFLDMGQADAVLIRHEGAAILYDAGLPLGSRDDHRVLDRLRELGVDTVGLLVASHPHYDHIAGMPAVVDSLVVLGYAGPGVEHDTQVYRRLMEALDRQEDEAGWLYRVDASLPWKEPVEWGEGPMLTWLTPPADSTHWDLNDRSLGLRVCLEAACILLGGDAEHAAWDHWLDTAPDKMTPVSVHKSSHHGSRNGDTAEAIKLLDPSLVVVSAGSENGYGHPHKVALDLYREAGARVLRTDYHREIVVHLTATGKVRTWVERWPEPLAWPLNRWPWGVLR